MAIFKLSGLIRNHSEQLSESQAVTVEGTGLQTVGRCWLEKSGQSILPESLGTLAPTKKEGWVLSRHAVPSSGSFSVNSSAAAVNLQMMADPRRGAPTGRQSLLKSCASSLPKAGDQTSLKVPEVLVERGSSKTQGSNFFFPTLKTWRTFSKTLLAHGEHHGTPWTWLYFPGQFLFPRLLLKISSWQVCSPCPLVLAVKKKKSTK